MIYRKDIDGLRALAVFAVIAFHLGFTKLSGGYLGVDVFFTISGFLITSILLRDIASGHFTAAKFYLRRIRRLIPPLLVTILVTWLAGVFILSPDHLLHLSKSSISAAFSVSNIFFWNDAGYFSEAALNKPLLHSWSLAVEEQFYLIWPAFILALYVIAKKMKSKSAIWGVILTLSLISIIASEWMLRYGPSAAFYLTPFRIAEFGIGALCIPLLTRVERHKALSTLLFLSGLVALITCFFLYTADTKFPGINSLFPALGTAAIILGGRNATGQILLSNPIAIWFGKISYSLYLVHWPVITYYHYAMPSPLGGDDIFAMFAISVTLAVILYYGIERVFRDKRKKDSRQSYSAIKTGGLITILVLVMGVSTYGWAGKGLHWRLPEDVQKYASSDEDTRRELLNGGLGCASTVCPMGAEQSERELLLLVGDSHMHHYFYGFNKTLKMMGQKGLMIQEGACPFFTEDIYAKEKSKDECVSERERFWSLADSKPSSPIILSQYWELYDEMLTADRKKILLPQASEKYGPLELYLKQELEGFIKRAGDRKITLITASPKSQSTESVATCLMRPDILYKLTGANFRRNADMCMTTPTKAEGFIRTQNINSMLSDIAANYSNVYILNPFDAFCDEKKCVGATDRTIYYRDDNHLSISGVEHFISTFREEIDFSFETPLWNKAKNAINTLTFKELESWFPQAKASLEKTGESISVNFPNDGRIAVKINLDKPYPAPFKLRLRAIGDITSKGGTSSYRIVMQRGCSPVPLEGQSFDFDTKSEALMIDTEMAILEPANCIMIRIWNGEVPFSADIHELDVSLSPL